MKHGFVVRTDIGGVPTWLRNSHVHGIGWRWDHTDEPHKATLFRRCEDARSIAALWSRGHLNTPTVWRVVVRPKSDPFAREVFEIGGNFAIHFANGGMMTVVDGGRK